MEKIVAFDQSRHSTTFCGDPTRRGNADVTFPGKTQKKLNDFNANRGSMVRSEGGRICCDFKGLQRSIKA